MKPIIFFFGIIFTAFIGLCAAAQADTENYIVALNNAPPYRIITNEDGTNHFNGIYIDCIKEIARCLNIKLTFKEVPFSRALAMMRLGEADIMVGPNKTSEREVFMHYLRSELPRENKVFYLSPKTKTIQNYKDLINKRIGIMNKAVYFDPFDSDTTLNKIKIPAYINGLKMLMAERLDAVIMPESLGDYQIKALSLPIKKSEYSIIGRPSYIALSKKSTLVKHATQLNDMLSALKADGSFDRILNKYR